MTAGIPEPGPEEEQPPGAAPGTQACDGWGGTGWAWAPGSAGAGPVPRCERRGPQPGNPSADGLPAGLDYAALVAALAASGALDTDPGDQDGELADWLAAEAEGRLEPCDPAAVAAVAVEHMDPGPALAGWLEGPAAGAGWLDEDGLAGGAVARRRAPR